MGIFRRKSPDGAVATRDRARRASAISIGVPGRCPRCDGFGYIDNIDVVHSHQEQHCLDCGHRWEYRFDEDGVLIDLTSDDPEIDLTAATPPDAPRTPHDIPPGEWLQR